MNPPPRPPPLLLVAPIPLPGLVRITRFPQLPVPERGLGIGDLTEVEEVVAGLAEVCQVREPMILAMLPTPGGPAALGGPAAKAPIPESLPAMMHANRPLPAALGLTDPPGAKANRALHAGRHGLPSTPGARFFRRRKALPSLNPLDLFHLGEIRTGKGNRPPRSGMKALADDLPEKGLPGSLDGMHYLQVGDLSRPTLRSRAAPTSGNPPLAHGLPNDQRQGFGAGEFLSGLRLQGQAQPFQAGRSQGIHLETQLHPLPRRPPSR
jgi:hypothetical protein